MTLPTYDFLPAPLWLVTALHILTLTLHFLAMNTLIAAVVALIWGKFKSTDSDSAVHTLLDHLPSTMAATITLGVAPLLFVAGLLGSLVVFLKGLLNRVP